MNTPPNGMTKRPTKDPIPVKLGIFYTLVLLLAFFGQAGGVEGWLIPSNAEGLTWVLLWGLVLAFVLVLELGTVVLLTRAEELRHHGKPAAVMIGAATVLALGAATLSFFGHWGEERADQIQACAFAGVTLLGFVIWLFMSDLREQPFIARRRTVRAAVKQFIKDLDLDDRYKNLVMASVDFDTIADDITRNMANELIADMLGKAIAPAAWHVEDENNEQARAEAAAAIKAEFEGIVAGMKAQMAEALGQAAALEKELAQVRVAADEEKAGLQREFEDRLREASQVPARSEVPVEEHTAATRGPVHRGNGSAPIPAQQEAVAQQPVPRQAEPVSAPTARAATVGNTVLQPQQVPEQARSAQGQQVSGKHALLQTLEQLLADEKVSLDWAPKDLVRAAEDAGVHLGNTDSATRYAREWRNAPRPEPEPARMPGVRYLADRMRPSEQ